MYKVITISMTLFMAVACSSVKLGQSESANLRDQRLATDFIDDGIKVYYTLLGKLEKIEVHGQAEAWKGNVEALAEADASAKLVKFIYGNDVSTERKIKIIGRAIEDAEDLNQKRTIANDDAISSTDKQLEEQIKQEAGNLRTSESARRRAALLNDTIVETATKITAKGKLVGVRKINDFRRSDGKLYVAVYQWSEKDQAISEKIRDRMNKN